MDSMLGNQLPAWLINTSHLSRIFYLWKHFLILSLLIITKVNLVSFTPFNNNTNVCKTYHVPGTILRTFTLLTTTEDSYDLTLRRRKLRHRKNTDLSSSIPKGLSQEWKPAWSQSSLFQLLLCPVCINSAEKHRDFPRSCCSQATRLLASTTLLQSNISTTAWPA